MRGQLRRAVENPARSVLRLLLCALAAFVVAGAVSSLRLIGEADGPRARFDLHVTTKRDRTYRGLGLFEPAGIERLRELVPGLRAISPYSEARYQTLELDGDRFELQSSAYVSPDYFTMGDVDVLSGTAFTAEEIGFGNRVALLSEAAATLIFPAGDAVGNEVLILPQRAPYRIVGIYHRARLGAGPSLLLPPPPGLAFRTIAVLAAPGSEAQVRDGIVAAARTIYTEEPEAAGYPPGNDFLLNSAGEYGSEASTARRTLVSLSLIGLVGLAVAAMGVFSMATVEVAQRQRTIGLQRSMGASRGRVVWSLMSDAAAMGGVGAALGLVLGGLVLPRLEPAIGIEAAVTRTNLQVDLVTSAATIGVIVFLSVVASIAPAIQAVRPSPVAALREA